MEQIEMAELRNMTGQNGLVFQDCDMAPQELLELINKSPDLWRNPAEPERIERSEVFPA